MCSLMSAACSAVRLCNQVPRQLLSIHLFSATPLQSAKYLRFSNARNYCSGFGSFKVSSKKVAKLRLRDGIPKDFDLIYNLPYEKQIRLGYCFLSVGTVLTLAYTYFNFYSKGKRVIVWDTVNTSELFDKEIEMAFVIAVFGLVTLVALSVLFNCPFRIYRHDFRKEYIAMYLGLNPFKLRQFHFQSACQKKFLNPLVYVMSDNCYLLDKRKAILMDNHFSTMNELYSMLKVKK